MRGFVFLAGMLVATPSNPAEPQVFYAAHFPDATSVQLSVLSSRTSYRGDYDFEVSIGLMQTNAAGAVTFEDSGKHHARIRCGDPAYVGVGAKKYFMSALAHDARGSDWKEDLWKAFCAAPTS